MVASASVSLRRVLASVERTLASPEAESRRGEGHGGRLCGYKVRRKDSGSSGGSPCATDPSGSGRSCQYRRSCVLGASAMYREWKSGGNRTGHLGRNDQLRTVNIELLEDPTHLLLRFSIRVYFGVLKNHYYVNGPALELLRLQELSEKD